MLGVEPIDGSGFSEERIFALTFLGCAAGSEFTAEIAGEFGIIAFKTCSSKFGSIVIAYFVNFGGKAN